MQAALFPIAVHCFFGWCDHVVREVEPRAAHDAMEAHYAKQHADAIRELVLPYVNVDRILDGDVAVKR
jgi:hypothetical protein